MEIKADEKFLDYQLIMILTFLSGYDSTNVDKITCLSSDTYPVCKNQNDEFHNKVTSWQLIDSNLILIEAEDGWTFLVDKVNVTFFSLNDQGECY